MLKYIAMRILIQGVSSAELNVSGKLVSKISRGEVVFVGFTASDTSQTVDKMLEKLVKIRMFEDEEGKTNLSLKDVDGEILFVSQFTLYADLSNGNRPSFVKAMKADGAKELYDYACKKIEEIYPKVKYGIFQADMQVKIVNEGPFTLFLDSKELNYD